MLERLDAIEKRFEQLNEELMKPETVSDIKMTTKILKEQSLIKEAYEKYQEYKKVLDDIKACEEMLNDADMMEFAKEELESLKQTKEALDQELEILLLPKDPNDSKNVIMEIRGAAGGDEANIFAGDLFRMYSKYCERQGFRMEMLNEVPGDSGGYAQVEFLIKGEGVYSKLKYESGAHRVQRVPQTESQGRIHTSTSTVVVMPEAEDIDIEIKQEDLKIDVYHSGGAGGQSVNTTDSAVRITHLPTNTVVTCQNERSQLKNKEKAMQILKARIYENIRREEEEKMGNERRNKIGTGDRSEKIRTYNYPQNRITDHRIGYTNMNLDRFMDGDIEDLIESLITEDQKRKLAETL